VGSSLTVLAVVALSACACGASTMASGPATARAATTVDRAPHPATLEEHAAAAQAVSTFRADLGTSSSAFVADVTRLQADLQAGDATAARSDELAAQAQFDQFRQLADRDPINASTLDELASDVAPGQSFGGLHAVERDLWAPSGGGVAQAGTDASGLVAQAPVAEYLLSKDSPAPEAIGVTGVDDLEWVTGTAVPEREELYSHRDAVDMAAGITAAESAFAAVTPLATLVAHTLTTSIQMRFATLAAEVAALGPPADEPDSALSPTTLVALAQQADATAAGLAQLSARLVPFGTGGAPS
jgi:iron uptake system component EfeO